MSKTVSTCILETNQVKGKPQENVFFHSLYRTKADFPEEFLRTAKSTSPIQICAVFSTSGPDALAAKLNISLNEKLRLIVAENQKSPVLNFDVFSEQVVSNLNKCVCDFVVNNSGTQLYTAMTMVIIEGDVLRIIHVGNTKAVLIRENKIVSLTEEQTVANRYVKLGAITPEEEKTHPDRMKLTQYLGKLPQDGPVLVDKKVQIKLKDDDEICVMGVGIAKDMPAQMRNLILVKPTSTELKTKELISSAFNYGIKSGLSVLLFKIESTFLLPGDAVIKSSLATEAALSNEVIDNEKSSDSSIVSDSSDEAVSDDTKPFDKLESEVPTSDSSDKKLKVYNKRKALMWNILVPVIAFVSCALLASGVVFLIAKSNGLFDKVKTEEIDYEHLYFVIEDEVPVYSLPDINSDIIDYLPMNQAVREIGTEGIFTKITYGSEAKEGYVLTDILSSEEINELPVIPSEDENESFIPDDEYADGFEPVEVTSTPTPSPIPTKTPEVTVNTTSPQNETSTTTVATTVPTTTTATPETTVSTETSETSAETSETTPAETSETTTETTPQTSETTEATTEATTTQDTTPPEPAPENA